jgi:hypothetical protein
MAGSLVDSEPAALDCAAPEVLRGRGATRASDVHALAVVVAQLIEGTPLPSASAAEAVHRGLQRRALVLEGSIPRELATVLRRALSRYPWRRPSAATIARALRNAQRPALVPHALSTTSAFTPRPDAAPRESPKPASLPATAAARLWSRALAGVTVAVMAAAIALVYRAGSVERAVSACLAVGDTQGARRLLREAERRGERGPVLGKLHGDVACADRAYGECLARYEAALEARPVLGRDPRLRENAFALAARGEDRRAVVALLARIPEADDDLFRMTQSARYWTRWNAVRALEARGADRRVDLARVYALDLLHAGSCSTRRAAAMKLTLLRDPRVVPELTQAHQAAQSSRSEWRCTGWEVEQALRAALMAQK